MWEVPSDTPNTRPGGARSSTPASAGPLQAFGQVHRALRENEKRLGSISGEISHVAHSVDDKVGQATRRMQLDGRKLRAETHEMLADLEELVLQMYEEHEAAIAEVREALPKARAELEAEQAQHRSALAAQQGQIDALAAALRRQQELFEEHVTGASAQMRAVQAEATELHRAFKAQGAAVQATKAFIGSVEDKLAAQIEQRVKQAEALGASSSEAWDAKHTAQQKTLERVLAWEPQLRSKDDENAKWRASVEHELGATHGRQQSAAAAVLKRIDEVKAELERQVTECRGDLSELADLWPNWVSELREAQTRSDARKANTSDVEERHALIDERLAAVAEQLAPLPSRLLELNSALSRVDERVTLIEPKDGRRGKELGEVSRSIGALHAELGETKAAVRANKQAMNTYLANEHSHAAAMGAVDSKVRQLGAMAEEHSRYLSTLGESLHAKNLVSSKFRASALAPPTFASPADSYSMASPSLAALASTPLHTPGARPEPASGAYASAASAGVGARIEALLGGEYGGDYGGDVLASVVGSSLLSGAAGEPLPAYDADPAADLGGMTIDPRAPARGLAEALAEVPGGVPRRAVADAGADGGEGEGEGGGASDE